MSTFKLRSKDFGLTYPDARDVSKLDIFETLHELVIRSNKCKRVMVCEEVGKSSGLRHFHAYVEFERKLTCNENTFDMFGLHCHIAKVKKCAGGRSIYPMVKYLTKEDRFPLANFDWNQVLIDEESKDAKRVPNWESYQEQSLTQNEVIEALMMDGFAKDFANHFLNWSAFIKRMYPLDKKENYISNFCASDFILPEQLTMWKFGFMGWIDNLKKGEWNRPNSLILIGPSRSGKTEWARSLGTHMYFNNLLNLDDWNEDADYIVLDDFSPEITKFLPSWKCFFGGQKQFTLTDKYRGKKTVRWGKPMIWLSNEDIFKHLNFEQIDFVKKNCTCIVLMNKLY